MLFTLDGEIISARVLGATIPSVDSEAGGEDAVVVGAIFSLCKNEVITEDTC